MVNSEAHFFKFQPSYTNILGQENTVKTKCRLYLLFIFKCIFYNFILKCVIYFTCVKENKYDFL